MIDKIITKAIRNKRKKNILILLITYNFNQVEVNNSKNNPKKSKKRSRHRNKILMKYSSA